MSITDLVRRHISDPQTRWAIGTFGAIAEFYRDPRESVVLSAQEAITARGGIRLQPHNAIRLTAWECPASGDSWTHGIALCLAKEESVMNARTVITELGPDAEALGEADRDAILFDLGIGAPHCDVCVRTAEPRVLTFLRAAAGRSLLDITLFDGLRRLSPTRVFVSRFGRVEVYTPIPEPEGTTPDGPHTHVMHGLLRHRRTHSANMPLPDWLIPCAEIFPPSAIHDAHGRRQRFDFAMHESFQKLLAQHGDPRCISAKSATIAAIRAGRLPFDEPSYNRAQRLARRVALRQIAQIDGPSRLLAACKRRSIASKRWAAPATYYSDV